MSATLSPVAKLKQLAINNDGFVFNPSCGDSYTVNRCGLAVMNGLREGKSADEISKKIAADFNISQQDAERDVNDFLNCLKNFRLL